jgi:hypothetical protein
MRSFAFIITAGLVPVVVTVSSSVSVVVRMATIAIIIIMPFSLIVSVMATRITVITTAVVAVVMSTRAIIVTAVARLRMIILYRRTNDHRYMRSRYINTSCVPAMVIPSILSRSFITVA